MKSKHEPFAWILIYENTNIAIMIGTWFECAAYQLKHGLRTTTEII